MKFILMLLATAVEAIRVNKYDGPLPATFDPSKGGDAFMGRAIRQYGVATADN